MQCWDNNFGENYRFHLQPDPFDFKVQQKKSEVLEEIVKQSAEIISATVSETLSNEIEQEFQKNSVAFHSSNTESKKSHWVSEKSSISVYQTEKEVTSKENEVISAQSPPVLAVAKSEYPQFKAHPLITTKTDLYLDDIIAKSNQTKGTHVELMESERMLHEDHIQKDTAQPSFCMNKQEDSDSTVVDEQIISHMSNNASISYSHHISVLKQMSLQGNNVESDAVEISERKQAVAEDPRVEIEDIILDPSPKEAPIDPASDVRESVSENPISAVTVDKSKHDSGDYFPEHPAQIQSSSGKEVDENGVVQQDELDGVVEQATNKSKPHLDTLLVVEESRTDDEFVDGNILDDKTLYISEGSLSSTDDDRDRKVKSKVYTKEAEISQDSAEDGKNVGEEKLRGEITDENVPDLKREDNTSGCEAETTNIEDVNNVRAYSQDGKSANRENMNEPEYKTKEDESNLMRDSKSSSESSCSQSEADKREFQIEKK